MSARTASGQLPLFAERTEEPAAVAAPPPRAARTYWPAAWDNDRPATIARLMRTEKWTMMEAAFYLRCVPGHIANLIDDGTITATNTARLPDSRPVWRIYRDKVLAFEKSRIEGAKD